MATLYLIRGAPGSGKSTLGHRLGHAISADDYMVDADGNYAFDPARLTEVHAKCLADARRILTKGADVAVCNVFQRLQHMGPYRKMAQALGAQVFELECLNDFGNVHGVPLATVGRMRAEMER
jgi:predicted kinase